MQNYEIFWYFKPSYPCGILYNLMESTSLIQSVILTTLLILGNSLITDYSCYRYHSLAPMYYRGAQAAIVVYDITNQDTFGRAKTWVKELQRQASPNIVIALAGNKQDLANKRMVEFEEAQTYADENGLLFMETSAKTAMNVNQIFMAIGKYTQCFALFTCISFT